MAGELWIFSVSLEDAITKNTTLPCGLSAQTTPPTPLGFHSDLELIKEALALALRYHECSCVKAMVKISNAHHSGFPLLSHPQEELTLALPFTWHTSWGLVELLRKPMVLEFCRLSEIVVFIIIF